MNRRQFLKAFATIGVSVALAEKAIIQAITDPVPLLTTPSLFSGEDRFAWLKRFTTYGIEEESRAGTFTLIRTASRSPLLINRLNAYGGILTMVFPPGGEIFVTQEHNVWLEADYDGVATLEFEVPGRGRVYLNYALLRERDPVLREQILLERMPLPRLLS